MLRLRQILQLLGSEVSQNKVCKTVGCSKSTVSAYSKAVAESGRSYAELLDMSDSELSAVFSKPSASTAVTVDGRKEQLETMMPEIVKRLGRRHAHIQFVFDDYYRRECPDGYGYTQFKKYVKEYMAKNDYSYHNVHEPGREWQIDFAGDSLYLTNRLTREKTKLVVLVCVMPYSNLPFMMALPKATTEWFFHGLNKGLEFMGALPKVARSDNMRQWVSKSDRYSLSFSEGSAEWALYYGIEPTACRVRKPRDKGPVEGAVNQLYKYIYARIEGDEYHTLEALNARIIELLDEYCSLPYKGSSRWEIFNTQEKPQMQPLPQAMYSLRMRKEVKLGSSYHVCVGSERHFYSVPYKYVGQTVKVMWDVATVEVYSGADLVCMHARSMVPYGYSTEAVHMPPNHLAYQSQKGENAATLIERGRRIGANVGKAIESVLRTAAFPQQAYGRCNGIMSLAGKYGRVRLDNACRIMAEHVRSVSYAALRDMLQNNRDLDYGEIASTTPYNNNVRGAEAYRLDNDRKEGGHGDE